MSRRPRPAPPRFAGRVAIVTGASRGIGRAIASALATEGASVVVGYRAAEALAASAVAEIQATAGGERRAAIACRADVRDPAQAARLAEAAIAAFGRIDILVHSAGVALSKLLIDTTPEEWRQVLATHVDGAFYAARAALPAMWRQRSGRIIVISSVWGLTGAAGEVAYSTAKAALIGFTKALAREVAPAGITVNAVAPGVIETDMLAEFGPEERADLVARTPAGRLGTPADVAPAVLFLASDAAGYVTGQVLCPTGGFAV